MSVTSLAKIASSSGVHINLDSAPLSAGRIVWAILILAFGICVVMSYALLYHWKMYGDRSRFMKFVQVVYFLGIGLIFTFLTIVTIVYSVAK